MEPTHADSLVPHQTHASGPGPFITKRIFHLPDGRVRHWLSRHHRKGLIETDVRAVLRLGVDLRRCLWMPHQLNWWIGGIFSIGATLFLLASLWSLLPDWAAALGLSQAMVNATFFLGSIPFTTAAYLQLYQAANAGEFTPEGRKPFRKRYWFGWRPTELGWWSCALQFVGTLLFNVNTFDALLPIEHWQTAEASVWVPNFLGSILFLVSGYFAFGEQCHAFWRWEWSSLSWWVVFTNLLGCIAFMISALFAFLFPDRPAWFDTQALIWTGLGAIGFLVGSLMMLPETVIETEQTAG